MTIRTERDGPSVRRDATLRPIHCVCVLSLLVLCLSRSLSIFASNPLSLSHTNPAVSPNVLYFVIQYVGATRRAAVAPDSHEVLTGLYCHSDACECMRVYVCTCVRVSFYRAHDNERFSRDVSRSRGASAFSRDIPRALACRCVIILIIAFTVAVVYMAIMAREAC